MYRVAKWLGLFRLARIATRRELRILCWHGGEQADLCAFRPGLFIEKAVFERRLAALTRGGYPVLALDEAVRRLEGGSLPDCGVALTIDDGFASTGEQAIPALHRRGLPATLYVTSYHVTKGTPVFRLLVQYAFWASRVDAIDLAPLGCGAERVSLRDTVAADRALWTVIDHGETRLYEPGRQALADRVAAALGVDLAPLRADRRLSLMSEEELRAAARLGVDVQLHTHRHRFPMDHTAALQEIAENRRVLEPLAGHRLSHFCYPSGVFDPAQFPWLEEAGIASATTCEVGLNRRGDHPYALRRFMDGSSVSQIEFEAELAGFAELVRRARNRLRRTRSSGARPSPMDSAVPSS